MQGGVRQRQLGFHAGDPEHRQPRCALRRVFQQRRLADAWLALDHERPAAPARGIARISSASRLDSGPRPSSMPSNLLDILPSAVLPLYGSRLRHQLQARLGIPQTRQQPRAGRG